MVYLPTELSSGSLVLADCGWVVGSKWDLMQREKGKKYEGRIGRERGNACKRSQKVVPVYWIQYTLLLVDYDIFC